MVGSVPPEIECPDAKPRKLAPASPGVNFEWLSLDSLWLFPLSRDSKKGDALLFCFRGEAPHLGPGLRVAHPHCCTTVSTWLRRILKQEAVRRNTLSI